MATHRLSVLGWATTPDGSGDVFFEPASIKGTNDFFQGMVLVFNDSGNDDELFGRFEVPPNYVGTANLVIKWTSTQANGTPALSVEWGFAYRAVNAGESLDQATAQESLLSGNDDLEPTATDEMQEYTIALTNANFAAGDTVQFIFSREGADAGDDIAAAVRVYGLFFEYNDA